MLRDFLKRRVLFWLVYLALGWWIGSKLVAIPNLQPFKVLNILGLTADLFGILILTRFVAQRPQVQGLILGPMAEHVYSLFFMVCIGLLARSQFGSSGPSSAQFDAFAPRFFMYVIAPVSAYLPAIVEHVAAKWDAERKTTALGGTLLVFGVLIQIWAAYLDLYS